MPPTRATSNQGLSIALERTSDKTYYCPGDVLRGDVHLQTTSEQAIGRITITFYARAKTSLSELSADGDGEFLQTRRGKVTFFEISQTLYEGYSTHNPGSFLWPFFFIIPDGTYNLAGDSDVWRIDPQFATGPMKEGDHIDLPPTFHMITENNGRKCEAYVEYVLQAKLIEPSALNTPPTPRTPMTPMTPKSPKSPRSLQSTRSVKSPKHYTSTLPLRVLPHDPIRSADINVESCFSSQIITIRSMRLLPDHAGAELGVKHKLRSIFNSSSLPSFSFDVGVQYPNRVRVLDTSPFTFILSMTPKNDWAALRAVPSAMLPTPKVRIKCLTMFLESVTLIRAPTARDDLVAKDKSKISLTQIKHPINFDLEFVQSGEKSLPSSIDLGSRLGIFLGQDDHMLYTDDISPSFTTFNISRWYELKWKLELECAGCTKVISSDQDMSSKRIEILGPAERKDSMIDHYLSD